jgi:hypothetical protein
MRMTNELHNLGRWLHLGSGFAAVGLGLIVMLMPKFGRRSFLHKWSGRIYATLIAGSCLIGVPLAYVRGSDYLMVLGTFTFIVVVQGWLDGRAARSALNRGDIQLANRRLRWHLILMGSSYIGAWSGFFATNQIFGTGQSWHYWFYAFGPTVIGAVFIARATV